MGIVNHTTIHDDAFNFPAATADDVYFAYSFALPFRLRVGTKYHCQFSHQSQAYDIWVKNCPIPEGDTAEVLLSLTHQEKSLEDLWSKVVVIPQKGKVSSEELEALRTCCGKTDSLDFQHRAKQLFPALQALNAFIVGYHTATGELFGGRPLQTLSITDFMQQLRWEVTVIGVSIDSWDEDSIEELFNLRADREFRSMESMTGEITDLSLESINKIESAIERFNDFYFYELAFEAKSKMVSSDYIGALLLAVAALEGAHGAFVTQSLKNKLPENRTGQNKNLEDEYLKELGFSLCNKLTPYLLMDEGLRPSQELIQGVATAVKYRNEVMHALRKSSGEYRIRTRTNAEISDAYSSALKMYELYRMALEGVIRSENENE